MKVSINLVLILALLSHLVVGQSSDSVVVKRKEIHLGIGPASYSGDLGNPYKGSSLLVTIGLKLNKNKKFNGNFRLSIGTVTGQELDYSTTDPSGAAATPNTFFRSSFIGLNYEAHYNFVDKERLKVYISQGVGFFRFRPENAEGEDLLDLPSTRPLGESYRNLTFQLPTQLGAKYYLPREFALGFQLGLINPITDHLDNLGKWGNKNGNDNVFTVQFQVSVPLN